MESSSNEMDDKSERYCENVGSALDKLIAGHVDIFERESSRHCLQCLSQLLTTLSGYQLERKDKRALLLY
jgi:hypothetical protein